MKTNSLHSKKEKQRNHLLAVYILGITVFMTVYTTLTLVAYT
ncbi:MAG: hypothetical protein R2781_05400 [Flavobacteriaceae bacterium]